VGYELNFLNWLVTDNPTDVYLGMTQMTEAMMSFKDELQKLRKKAELSQAGLARKAGISVRSIQNWEQGHRGPKAMHLMALARALGVSVETLLAELEKESPRKKTRRRRKGN
jgi:transcriptional regulator with XRE-family HTH domain